MKYQIITEDAKRIIADLESRIRDGEDLQLQSIVAIVDPSTEPTIRDWSIDKKICSGIEWRKAVAQLKRDQFVISALGAVPQSPADFIRLYFDIKRVDVTGEGLIRFHEVGSKVKTIDDEQLKLRARVAGTSLDLRYSASAIDDATFLQLSNLREARIETILASVKHDASARFDWDAIARATIALDETVTCEFAVANLQHFIWQVKRKQAGLPVDHHLMVILGGAQETGKSTFAKLLFSPVTELTRSASFSQITDDRIIEIWRSSVIFLDEMSFASKSDADEVKNVITASTLDRRPMRSNSLVKIKQCATMIGTTNQTLAQIIRDTTGTRRFSFLPFTASPDYPTINAADWLAAWRSIDENAQSPIVAVKATLREIQADSRLRSSVEQWIDSLSEKDPSFPATKFRSDGNPIPRSEIFEPYREWCDRAEIAPRDLLDLQGFTNELKRLALMSNDAVFKPKRSRHFNGFTYSRTPSARAATLKVVA